MNTLRPPTPGYDPHNVLWHLFHQTQDRHQNQKGIGGCRSLTGPERKQINSIVSYVTEHAMHPKDSTLVARFKAMMLEKNGTSLGTSDEALVQGLLYALDAYKPYSSWTNPENIHLGIYDHFKGGIYDVHGFSGWSSGHGELVVEYQSMLFATKHTRFASEWCECVQWPDGEYRSRYVYRSKDLTVPAPAFKVPNPTILGL
jgi:hypothetical protein